MDIVKFSIKRPVVVIVGILLVLLFGFISLSKMPYQLTPTVTKPLISVKTTWPGATPYEIEREIIEPQERVLKGVANLTKLESSSKNSIGEITMEFKIGTDLGDSMLLVSNKLNEVKSYPENVDKPVINTSGESTSPVIWMLLKAMEGNERNLDEYRSFFEEEVSQSLERIDGVSELFFPGGTDRELHITVDSDKLAAYKIPISLLISSIRGENVNISAGNMDIDRKSYRIRTTSEFKNIEDIQNRVIRSDGERIIYFKDVATVSHGYADPKVFIKHNNKQGLVVGVRPVPGTNILDLTNEVEQVVFSLNDGILKDQNVYLEWVYDQRRYINGALELVKQNIAIGGVLAMIVLFIFLRSFSSTVIVSMAIPISIIGTFTVMNFLDRSLNVVSMAGISFAVGMLVDSAIVVLENIDRHRKMGKNFFHSAYDGTREVIGAIIASVLTTIAIFIPILTIEEEAGQLFKDIALAATSAVTISLFVSMSVIPMLSYQILRFFGKEKEHKRGALQNFGLKLVEFIVGLVRSATKSNLRRVITVVVFTTVAIFGSYKMFPKMEYLPQGNENLIINILIPPPGLSYEERKNIGEHVFAMNDKYFAKDDEQQETIDGIPPIRDMFFVGADGFVLFGARSTIEDRASELIPQFMKTIYSIPGMFGISMQRGIFERGLGKGRTIDVDISGSDLNKIVTVSGVMFGMMKKQMPEGTQIRPQPSIEMQYPEVRIIPDSQKLKAVGLSALDFGVAIDVLMDGRIIGDFKEDGKEKIDLILKSKKEDINTPEELYFSDIYTPQKDVVPISSLSQLERGYGITEIRHLERARTITLQVTPPKSMALEEAMSMVEDKLVPALHSQGMMDGVKVSLSGSADQLTVTRKALEGGFILAVVIIYLLMAALYSNFVYPFIIIFTVPLAVLGGFVGLFLVNAFVGAQALDILTMLGFIILVGIVVNNAILIVYQAINNIRERAFEHYDAVMDAVRTRLRPIYMSTLTSIFGMLPLVLSPGPGSEIYRGLGAVILGGLALSSLFTIFVIPALLLFFIKMEKSVEDIEEKKD